MTRPDLITPLVDALNARAEACAAHLLPAGKIEAGEWSASSKDTRFGAVSVVLKGAKRGRVGFWQGRPDAPGVSGGDLLHLFMAVHGCDLKGGMIKAREWLGGAAPPLPEHAALPDARDRAAREADLLRWRQAKARDLFERASPLADCHMARPIEYLTARGIYWTRIKDRLSDRVRFAPSVEYWRGATGHGRNRVPGPKFPAIITAIDDENGVQQAVHVTFLARDGLGKAPVEKAKLMMGQAKGGTIRLCEPSGPDAFMVINEGLENGLTALMAQPKAWGARVAPSLDQLDAVRLSGVRGAIVCPHNDWNNPAAMRSFQMKLANLRRQGVPVRVLRASDDVNDLNDMVKPRGGQ